MTIEYRGDSHVPVRGGAVPGDLTLQHFFRIREIQIIRVLPAVRRDPKIFAALQEFDG